MANVGQSVGGQVGLILFSPNLSSHSGPLRYVIVAISLEIKVSHIIRKPVFGVCDQVRLKPACSITETS